MAIRERRLYRSRTNRTLLGICGGLGEYLDVDPVVVRLVWVAVTCFILVVPAILLYLAAWLIIPEEPVQTWAGSPAAGEPGTPS